MIKRPLIFVDTGPLFSLVVESEKQHGRALSLFGSHRGKPITTDYIIDELLTVFRSRRLNDLGLEFGASIFAERQARIEWVTSSDVMAGWSTFCKFRDKRWSFTDCVSRAVIDRMGIPYALSFDEHFRQFGNVTVLL